MAHMQVDLLNKESGSIWTRRPSPSIKNGLYLEVSNTKPGLTSQGRHLQFTRVAFSSHGNWFIAGDQHGCIFQLDLAKNKFRLIHKAGQSCTALASCTNRPNEVLVALADYTLRCIDVDSGEVVATLRGHEACVKSLSLHSSGRLALAVSSRDSVLWDLDTFARVRTLSGGQEVGVQDVFFLPFTNTILSCFKDDSIHAWDTDSLDYKYQIPPPYGPTPHYRAFVTSNDGRLLVAGGRSSFIHIWKMESRQLLRIVQLPSKVRLVKQLLFLTNHLDGEANETLGFLAQDGILRFIDIHSCKLLFQLGSSELRISSALVSPDGGTLTCVSEKGNLLLYDVTTVSHDLHKPPAPLVSVVEEKEEGRVQPTKMAAKDETSTQEPFSKTPVFSHKSLGQAKDDCVQSEEVGVVNSGRLQVDKLLSILKGYGEYPAKYRTFIWRCLLRLPDNHSAYSSLLDKGTHPSFLTLHQHYPIKSRKLLRVLQRALSVLGHWASIFSETPYLPALVFPFVKLFQNNQLVTFEILATILMNWCGQWFEYFPNPPLNVLAIVENCLAHHDAQLLEHFIKHNVTSHLYVWPLLETLFSEVLSRDSWLRLWDNVFSNHPGFLLLLAASYLISARSTLLQCVRTEDFEYFIHHTSTVDIGTVIQEAYHMQQTTPPDIHPENLLPAFEPLTRGTYPVFNKYPKFIVDYQVVERERIRKEELDYLRERQSALELERLTEQRRLEEEAWTRQQQLLVDAEEQRRKMIEEEDTRLTDQRARLQALKRELKVKEVQVLDAARHRFLSHQQKVRESELHRMDSEIQRKVVQRERETKDVLTDIETRALELERQKALLEQELGRCQEEMVYRLRADVAAHGHREELEQSMLGRAVEEEASREREKLDRAQAKLAQAQAKLANTRTLQEAEARRTLRDVQTEVRMEEVTGKARLNQLKEQQLHALTEGLASTHQAQLHHERKLGKRRNTSSMVSGTTQESGVTGDTRLTGGEGLTVTDLTSSSSGGDPSSVRPDSYGQSALDWSRRRDHLNRQEAELLSRVKEVRQRVAAGQAHGSSSLSHSESQH